MAKAEIEKLKLLREQRAIKEKFYYNLAILSGGTLSAVIALTNLTLSKGDKLVNIITLVSILSIALSFLFALFRNLFAANRIKLIVQDKEISDYNKVIRESLKENCLIKTFSIFSVLFFIVGLVAFAFTTVLLLF